MEIINMVEMKSHTWENFFLMEALTTVFDKISFKDFDGTKAEVSLIINGIECPFVETVRLIGKQHEEMIEEKAKNLIKLKMDEVLFDKLNSISNLAQDLERELKHEVDHLFNDFG